MARTSERDAAAVRTAASLGWSAIRVWECELRDDAAAAARRVLGARGPTQGAGAPAVSETMPSSQGPSEVSIAAMP